MRNLEKRDCFIKVFPYNSTFEEMNDFMMSFFAIIEDDNKFNSFVTGDSEEIDESQQDAIRKKHLEENKKFIEHRCTSISSH